MTVIRSNVLSTVRSIVVKLGTQLLTDKTGRLDEPFLSTIASQVAAVPHRGVNVTLVSSGAIGAGLRELNLPSRPTDLARLQAVAAVGQRRLMDGWASAFAPFKLHVAQLLLTREDVDDRKRFLNLRNTLHAVHELGGVPVINENDSISTDELAKISFGDNDILAALVTHALHADLLVLLSVVDGILDPTGVSVRTVDNLETARDWVRTEIFVGKGGMNSKLNAAETVTSAGSALVVADGRMPNVLDRLLVDDTVGTLFVPHAKRRSGRDRWIGSARPVGTIRVDAGAAKAIVERNTSLLPAGITGVDGAFAAGDVVAVVDAAGVTIARGLSNYSAGDIDRIKGKKTQAVRGELADAAYDEVVHRDNMVVQPQTGLR